MYNQAVIREGFKYGAACALVGFGALLILFFTGTNPFAAILGLTIITLPTTLFFGVYQFKKYINPDIGFLKALSVALIISATAAVLSGSLVLGLAHYAGKPALDRHRNEMKAVLEDSTARAKTLQIAGKDNYKLALKEMERITPLDLALDDFYKKLGIGFILSLIAATFFRK
jgi:hypothetical protein